MNWGGKSVNSGEFFQKILLNNTGVYNPKTKTYLSIGKQYTCARNRASLVYETAIRSNTN